MKYGLRCLAVPNIEICSKPSTNRSSTSTRDEKRRSKILAIQVAATDD